MEDLQTLSIGYTTDIPEGALTMTATSKALFVFMN
jgi:hypothetical protein